MSDTKGQRTNEKETQKTQEKKDEGKEPKAHAGASGEGTDNTSAGSGGRPRRCSTSWRARRRAASSR